MGTPETRATATAVAWAHAEAALNGVDPACGICASFTLARANKRLAFWERTDAGKAAPAPSGGIPPEGLRASSASGSTVLGSRSVAAAAPASLSPSPTSLVAADHEAVELPPGCEDQPVPEVDFGLDNESLLDFSDEQGSVWMLGNISPGHIQDTGPAAT